jgi:hypothetical protein
MNMSEGVRRWLFASWVGVTVGAVGITLLAGAPFRTTAIAVGSAWLGPESVDAKAVWEEAIRAKGGRERLHTIRNFVTMSREEFPGSPRPDVITHAYYERLYILPNKLWEYYDSRPGKMGDDGLALDIDHHRVLNRPNLGSAQRMYDDLVYRLRNGQFLYFMETAYVQPEPVGLKRGRLDRRDIDVIETRVNGDRVEFSLDRHSHLPVRVAIMEQRLRFPRVWWLSDYQSVDGILMPRNVHPGENSTETELATYQFNVDYDDSVFIPGSVRFEKNGWMKR